MQFYKRGEYLVFNGGAAEIQQVKKVLHKTQYYPSKNYWTVPATMATFVDVWHNYKDYLAMQDTETATWVSHMSVVARRLLELQQGIKDGKRDVTLPTTIDYVWEPFQHQKEALAFALNLPKCALWLDMGLGKTYTSITLAKLRHADTKLGGIHKVLVVAPRSLLYQWSAEIKTLAPDAEVYLISGTPSQKRMQIASVPHDKFSFALITYEGLHSLYEDLEDAAFDMFILDEATKIKNPKAQRTQATAGLCQSIPYGVALTGMAYVGNPLDLYSQFLAIDPTLFGTNQYVFANQYIDYGVAPFGKYIKGYKHIDELKQRAYFYAFSRTKWQCLDLPPKVYQTRKLPLYEAQYMWYDNLLGQMSKTLSETNLVSENGMYDIDGNPKVTVDYVVTMLEKFQQVTAGFIRTDDGEYIWLNSPKYEEMWDILKGSNESFLIWAKHTYVLKKIKEYLYQKGIEATVLDRRVDDARRAMIKREFKEGKRKIIICQISSECRGNDFTCEVGPVNSIFFENTPSIEERMQAEDRQHRIGMNGTALYIDLVCEDTYDEGIQLLQREKGKISTYIREQNLNILLGKGGSVVVHKTKSKKKPKTPAEVEARQAAQAAEEVDYLDFIDGMETL